NYGLDSLSRSPMASKGDDGECDLHRPRRHRDEQTIAQRSCQIPRLRFEDSDRTLGRFARDCGRGGLSGVQRRGICDGQRAVCRRRMDGAMTASRKFSTKISKGNTKVTSRTKDIKKEKETLSCL